MVEMSAQPTDSQTKGSSPASCSEYCDKVNRKALQKKPISIDLGQLLRTQLNRCLRTVDLVGYGIAAMIGGTIFVLTGTIARNKSGPATFLAYIMAGLIAILNAVTYAELSCRFPKAGSTYTYVYVLLGELPAFLAGWSILLEYILSISTVARGWSSSLNALTHGAISNWTTDYVGRLDKPNGFFAEELDFVAAGLVIVVVVTTCFGIEKSSWLNLIFTALNVGVLTLAAVYMLIYAQPDFLLLPLPTNVSWTPVLPLDNLTPFLPYGVAGLIAGTATCFNAFIGFDMLSMCAEETRDPEKSIPRANVISVTLVTLLLSVATLSLTMYIPWYMLDIGAPFLEALQMGGGERFVRVVLFYAVGVGCLIGIFSNLLTSAIGAPRILYAMGQDGLVFSGFAKVTEPFKTPLIATIPIGVIACLLTLVFSISSLADFMCLGTLVAYSMCSMGILILRYCPIPEKVITAARIPEPSAATGLDREKEDLARQYGDIIEEPNVQKSTQKFDFSGASNINKPGYLKTTWANFLPYGMVKHMTEKRAPGEVCRNNMCCFLIIVLLFLFTVLIAPYPQPVWFNYWRIAGAILCILGLLCCCMVFSMHAQFRGPRPNLFRLPMVPFLPCVTIIFNTVLISQLSWMTWVRFLIWVVFGLLIYFAYGVRHSHPTDDTETDVLLAEKE